MSGMATSQTRDAFKLEQLAKRIESGESSIRWVDFYAAQQAFEFALESEEGDPELVFDLVLVLSIASGRGEHCMDERILADYAHYFVFNDIERVLNIFEAHPGLRNDLADSVNGEAYVVTKDSPVEPQQLSLLSQETVQSKTQGRVNQNSAETEKAIDDFSSAFVVIEDGKVYLTRYWKLQSSVDSWFTKAIQEGSTLTAVDEELMLALSVMLKKLDGKDSGHAKEDCAELDRQMLATAMSLISPVLIVSGGPGTGKTTTAAKILIATLYKRLFDQSRKQPLKQGRKPAHSFKVDCIAPTGKAAQRLVESLRMQAERIIESLDLDQDTASILRGLLPSEGRTIHRYLSEQGVSLDDLARRQRVSENQRLFGAHQAFGVAPDIVLVDESSMIDLALMNALLQSFAPDTQAVFLGDPDQLPAIEPGTVFSSWVNLLANTKFSEAQLKALQTLLPESANSLLILDESRSVSGTSQLQPLVQLTKSYRFQGLLGDLAASIRDGDPESMSNMFSAHRQEISDGNTEFCFIDYVDVTLDERARQAIIASYESYFQMINDPDFKNHNDTVDEQVRQLQSAFEKAQVLCSTRQGQMGCDALNDLIESAHIPRGVQAKDYYVGKPMILEQNYSHLDLFNGDIGFLVEALPGVFSLAFYRGEEEPAKLISPSKVPNARAAFAITVHKSQGSEYDELTVVLPSYAEDLITRALLYTAVTRTKRCLTLLASQSQLIQRTSQGGGA